MLDAAACARIHVRGERRRAREARWANAPAVVIDHKIRVRASRRRDARLGNAFAIRVAPRRASGTGGFDAIADAFVRVPFMRRVARLHGTAMDRDAKARFAVEDQDFVPFARRRLLAWLIDANADALVDKLVDVAWRALEVDAWFRRQAFANDGAPHLVRFACLLHAHAYASHGVVDGSFRTLVRHANHVAAIFVTAWTFRHARASDAIEMLIWRTGHSPAGPANE